MGVQQSFIESVELSGDVELTVQVNGSRIYLSLDGNPTSVQLHLQHNDIHKIIPVLELAQAYIVNQKK